MSDSNRRTREMNIRTVQQLKELLMERREKREFVSKKISDFFQEEYRHSIFLGCSFRLFPCNFDGGFVPGKANTYYKHRTCRIFSVC